VANVFLSAAAQADVDGLPDAIYHRVLGIVERLAHWPGIIAFAQAITGFSFMYAATW
jgi:hypothetical protein